MASRGSGEANFSISATLSEAEVKALKRGIKDAGAEARKEVRTGLKSAGMIVANEIKSRTRTASKSRKGAHKAGLLKKSTRLKIATLKVTIYNSAVAKSARYPKGYRYGKRLEFDPAFGYSGVEGSSRYAFFYPGYRAVKAKAMARFDQVLIAARNAYMR